jgi:hypothetical protein
MATAVATPTYVATCAVDVPETTLGAAFDAFVKDIPTHVSFWAVVMAVAMITLLMATLYTCYATMILTRTPQSTYL